MGSRRYLDSLPRKGKVGTLAKKLVARFGSFGAVVSAPAERLEEINGVGPAVLAALKTVQACGLRLLAHRAHTTSTGVVFFGQPIFGQRCSAVEARGVKIGEKPAAGTPTL